MISRGTKLRTVQWVAWLGCALAGWNYYFKHKERQTKEEQRKKTSQGIQDNLYDAFLRWERQIYLAIIIARKRREWRQREELTTPVPSTETQNNQNRQERMRTASPTSVQTLSTAVPIPPTRVRTILSVVPPSRGRTVPATASIPPPNVSTPPDALRIPPLRVQTVPAALPIPTLNFHTLPTVASILPSRRQTRPLPLALPTAVPLRRDFNLLYQLMACSDLNKTEETSYVRNLITRRVYSLELMSTESDEIHTLFCESQFRRSYDIIQAWRVRNPFLRLHYLLNKHKLGTDFEERWLYHGTTEPCANRILEDNFNWRCHRETGSGEGVYFANDPVHAAIFGRNRVGRGSAQPYYVMIVATVLVERRAISRGVDGTVPEYGHTFRERRTSSRRPSFQELIKFDDCCFYPKYLVHFDFIKKNSLFEKIS